MSARRSARRNPVIGGIDLPDDVWVALDQLEAAGRQLISPELHARLTKLEDEEHRIWVLQENAQRVVRQRAPDDNFRQLRAMDTLLNVLHERTDGLSLRRMTELAPGREIGARTTLLERLRYFRHSHEEVDELLERANRLMNGHGVEPLTSQFAWVDRYYQDIVALYVNVGDPWRSTVLFDTELHRFSITSWGEFMEKWEHENTPRCAQEMGALCAFHARGGDASEPCNASEED